VTIDELTTLSTTKATSGLTVIH